jgi:hypothetical protein
MRAPLLFCVILLAACDGGPTEDIFAVEGFVAGQITGPDGTPVPDTWVALDGVYPLRNGNTIPVYDSTQADALGRFRGRLALLNLPDTIVSFDIRVWPPAASGLSPDETIGLGLQVTHAPAPTQNTFVMNIQLAQ